MICLQEFVGIRLEKSLVCVYERNTRRSRKREFCRAIFPFDHRASKLPCIGSQRKVDPRIGNAPNLLALALKASNESCDGLSLLPLFFSGHSSSPSLSPCIYGLVSSNCLTAGPSSVG